jgi:probable H4MPT-linked C1 transfer pathway protein
MVVLGFDVGGAHLKVARIEAGRVVGAVEIACPLWQGIDRLDAAFSEARNALGEASQNAVTMTGELSDIFPTRAEGVARISSKMNALLAGHARFYAGGEGWLTADSAAEKSDAVASANWHATASLTAHARPNALFIDMGSTTTDIVPIVDGKVFAHGATDAARMQAGELVYTGATRTFLMAVAPRVPFKGVWTPVMGEYFASMADVHRVLGVLPEGADLHATADGREKTAAASAARLARMIGRDASNAKDQDWKNLAEFFAEAQLRTMHDAALQVLSSARLPDDAPVVAAGTGRFVVERLATRLGRPYEKWEALVRADSALAEAVSACAPAVAVALLLRITDRRRKSRGAFA